MYQVFDASDIFGPPPAPPSNDDFTLQRRYRDPDEGGGGGGGGIDDVLGWLGIPSPGGGGGIRAGYDDPGGGFSWGTTAGFRALDETGLGQLMMETDNDDGDYFEYSCLSSGLVSPDVESEFFGSHCVGHQLPLRMPEPTAWSFNPSYATLPDRPPSPLFGDFRFIGATTGSDSSYPMMTSYDRHGDLPFDSEAEAKVKEIARYLASFEVQPWSVATPRSLTGSCSTPGSNPTSPFQELSSISGSTSPNQANRTAVTSGQKVSAGVDGGSASVGIFHAGFDDSCGGLETTMVNPNDVFPDRIDHQYASSRPTRDHRPRVRHTPRPSSQRTSPHSVTPPKGRASSVLEALLLSTEPIDPNKGSGAAVVMEGDDEDVGEDEQRGVGRRTTDRSLKKLLTGKVSIDDDLSRKGHKGHTEEPLRAKRLIGPAAETEMAYRTFGGTSGRAFPGFADVKLKTNVVDECELARELGEIIREQTVKKTNAGFPFTSEFRSAECFRCN